jgi:outer membrane protein TolC
MSFKSPPSTLPSASRVLLACAALSLILPSCKSAAEHEADADDEVYNIVAERRAELGETALFSIAPPENSLRQRILRGEELLGLDTLSLTQCQRIAAENSRDYQARKEALYLAALDLTLERYQFGYRVDAAGSAVIAGDDSGASDLNADAGLTFSKVMGNGANVVLDLGANIFESLANGDPSLLLSSIGLTITRPLLSGASEEAIFESLTRAERRVVDQARSYERFRRTFAVDMFGRYWRLLEEVEVVKNEEINFTNLVTLRERNEAYGEAGRMADIEVGQARQDELRAKARVISANQRLEGLLDDLKLFLGLPIDVEIGLDSTYFKAMNDEGINPIDVDEDKAVALAIASRLDMATDLDNVSDAERALRIALDDLGTSLDLTVASGASSEVQSGPSFDSADVDWSVGLDVNFPIDRLVERNRVQAAKISLEVAHRNAFLAADLLRVDVRDALRRLKAEEDSFVIAESAVPLAERRVEGAELQLEAGNAQTRDVLEAREDLLQARNERIGALVDYQLANLDLFLTMEQLDVDEEGVSPRELAIVTPRVALEAQASNLQGEQSSLAGEQDSQTAGEPAKE